MAPPAPPSPRPAQELPAAFRWAALLGLAAAVAAAYWGSLAAPLLYDDHVWITANPSIRSLWPPGPVLAPAVGPWVGGRPVVNLSLALNYAVGGDRPLGYHAANVAIHLLAALALFGVARRTLDLLAERVPAERDRLLLALAVSLLWAVHPIQTEAVTYVSERSESLMGLFYLLTLYGFIRGARPGASRAWLPLSAASCLLGMATKEVMATAPLLVLAYDRTFVAGSAAAALRLRPRYYGALAASWVVLAWLCAGLRARGVGYGLGFTWWAYGLTQCWGIVHYLRLALVPHPLVFDYGVRGVGSALAALPWALALAALAAAAWAAFRRRTLAGYAGAWVLGILAPASSVIPVAFQPVAEHRMYLPLAGVVALGVAGAWCWLGRRSLPLLGAAALALGALTCLRNADYRSEVSIWSDTVLRRPENPRARLALGEALAREGRHPEAAQQFSEAIRIDPGDAQARHDLGLALFRMGRAEEALAQYRSIVAPSPDSASLHRDTAMALERLGRLPEAAAEFARAAAIDPADPEARAGLARLGAPQPSR